MGRVANFRLLSLTVASLASNAVAYIFDSNPSTQEICTTEPAPNLLVNPSWEDGTSSWTYITPGGSVAVTTAQASDGSKALLLPSQASYTVLQQTVQLVVGQTYDISLDLRGDVSQSYSITEQCIIYLYHDALTTTNLLASGVKQYNRAVNTGWQTLSERPLYLMLMSTTRL
ncbi:hypothetical protein F5Y03DRAFT_394230 [Xylaria venustula]|nr:hypothetical protein F5Y03DRAFT_394230 [Xylaria venustula]